MKKKSAKKRKWTSFGSQAGLNRLNHKHHDQELINQKSAADAKGQQLENEARNKDIKILELERKVKSSETIAK